ncbi:MAG: hypothetical protein IKA85_00295 [Clostridia bacterium]|nr:hypothetical protein [Clostridia bacterium]
MSKMKAFFRKIGKAIKHFFLVGILNWFKNWCKAKTALCIALALVIAGGFLASMIQTDFFRVSIETKTIVVDIEKSGNATSSAVQQSKETGVDTKSVADIYRPKYANEENLVPMVLVAPGIQRTKETQASFCIELVRRGYGVICLDPYGQGESTPSYEKQSATNEGYGLFHWMDYMHTDEGKEYFNWVDYTRIGATGHSAGGNGAQKLAEREGKNATDRGDATSRLAAVYITGYIRGWNWSNTKSNIGISYSSKDEGAYQNETALKKADIQAKLDNGQSLSEAEERWLTIGNADMRYAPESIEIVNYQLDRNGEALIDEVEVGASYGNPYTYTYAVINNESCLHAFQPYDSETLTNMVSFFGYVFENYDENGVTQSGIKDTNQAWLWKEIGGGMVLVGGFVFIMALFVLLLKTKAFKSLKKERPARTGDQKVKGRIFFWLAFAISAVIAYFLYMVAVQKSVEWFPDAAGSVQTWFFPQRFTNAIMIWAVANGIIGVGIFFLTWGIEYLIDYVRAKKTNANVVYDTANGQLPLANNTTIGDVHASYKSKLDPLKLKGSDFWKTPLLAAILILSFFAIDGLCYAIFHVDMRFFFLSARFTLNGKAILAMAMYLPLFFIFYMSNSLRVNCSMRPSNWPEWLSQVIAVLGNTLGLVALVVVQYAAFGSTGVVGFTGEVGPQWLFVNMLFSIIPMMAALPLLNRWFFNKSGRAWIGAMVVCAIFIIMTGSGTTIYYAL